MSQPIDVLWTGGWDSTYRVLLASLIEKKEVTPHYIVDLNRKSSLRELKAISDVRSELRKIDEDAAGRIKALKITPITEISPIEEVTQSYQRLKEQAHLGGQYDWLSRYARQERIDNLELSVHIDDKAYWFLQGKVEQQATGTGWRLANDAEGDIRIFSCFSFPLLETSKTDMRDQATKFGFISVLEKSWFCFNPMSNKPCGTCNPCIYTIEEGMSYRLPNDAIFRYKTRDIRKAVRLPMRATKKVYRKLRA